MKKFIALVVLGAIITACSNAAPKRDIKIVHKEKGAPGKVASAAKGVIIESSNPELKEAMQKGAIEGPGGLYFMPIGKDSGGCPYYTSFAPGKVTLTTVYYRKPDGSFTNSRNEADCVSGK